MKLASALLTVAVVTLIDAFAEPTSSAPTIMKYDDTAPDPVLSPREEELVHRLSQAEVIRIDQELLANCTHYWRKVAMVVGTTMGSLESRTIGIPAAYYAQRVAKLVREGRLESQGDLQRMRYSEIRLLRK